MNDIPNLDTLSPDRMFPVAGRLYWVRPTTVPGITVADALDANDAMGSVFSVEVPKAGIIVKAIYYDLDDEGLSKELWVSPYEFTGVANDAAFSLSDIDLQKITDVITFQNFKDATNGQIAISGDTPLWYTAPHGRLYLQFKTLGVDNIADGSLPQVAFLIERAGG